MKWLECRAARLNWRRKPASAGSGARIPNVTTFLDGPAEGQALSLKRAPRFLRVVQAAEGWDALDQLEDTAAAHEKFYAYELEGTVMQCFVRPGGLRLIASYRAVKDQPTDGQMRENADWRDWCLAQLRRKPLA